MNKRGSTSVFLVLILAGTMGVAMCLVGWSRQMAAVSVGDDLLRLAGRSVLSEYDRGLKEDYGIFAFRGQPWEIAREMSGYVNYSLTGDMGISLSSLNVETGEYSLQNVDHFEEAIQEYMAFATARGLLKEGISLEQRGYGQAVDTGEKERGPLEESILHTLPSGGTGEGSLWRAAQEMLGDPGRIFARGTTQALMNQYIMDHFKSGQHEEPARDSFFRYEMEYILEGKADDNENRKAVRRQLLLLRNAIDFAFLLTDPERSAALSAAAQAITPGVGEVTTKLALAEAWALAEAENDIRLLEHGRRVPLAKTGAHWQVDLESIVKEKKQGYIDDDAAAGLTYDGYLQLFLFCLDREAKYGRMMDLIQLNIQGTRDGSFLVREHSLGFHVEAGINGRKYAYDQKY